MGDADTLPTVRNRDAAVATMLVEEYILLKRQQYLP